MAYDDSEKLRPYSWPELLTRPRREQLVDEILFSKGVTTLVAQSGEGKTTFANSVGLTVATGGTWDGKIIKPRPLVWCAGEGQDDMRPMYEAWTQFHPDAPTPLGLWLDEAIDFSSERATKQFNELLKDMKMAEAVIVPDALADHIAGLDENTSKDINQVYRNIWEVVKLNGAAFLIPHHAGWDEKRERGSTAIRAKSDIVLQIVKFEAEKGIIELKHHKRRGGRKLPQILFEIKLIDVEGYAQAIPIVTGMKPGAVAARELGDYAIMIICLDLLGGRAIRARWFDQVKDFTAQRGKPWSDDTFDRRRKEMQEEKGWIVGGPKSRGDQGVPYEFAATEEARRARAEASGCTWTSSEDRKSGVEDPSANHPHGSPLQGAAGPAGGFFGPATTRKAPANNFAGGSRESGDQSDLVAEKGPKPDVRKRAIDQLKPQDAPKDGKSG